MPPARVHFGRRRGNRRPRSAWMRRVDAENNASAASARTGMVRSAALGGARRRGQPRHEPERRDRHGRRRVDMGLRSWWLRVGLMMMSACLCDVASADPTVELRAGDSQVALSPYVSYRHDISGIDRIDDAWQRVGRGEFTPLPGGNAAFGFQRGAFGFHAAIVNRNADEQRWLLLQQYPLSDRKIGRASCRDR